MQNGGNLKSQPQNGEGSSSRISSTIQSELIIMHENLTADITVFQ